MVDVTRVDALADPHAVQHGHVTQDLQKRLVRHPQAASHVFHPDRKIMS